MKKKAFIPILLCLLLLFPMGASATASFLLSDAIPTLSEDYTLIKSAYPGQNVGFSATDFKQALGIKKFKEITIETVPPAEDGILYYGDVPVKAGDVIPRESLDLLLFRPVKEGLEKTAFTFRCENYAGGAPLTALLRFVMRINEAPTILPVIASSSVSTYRDMTVEGTLCATDPEGDELCFMVLDYPDMGTLRMLNTAVGDFRYTPKRGYTGSDSFTYVVRDCYGNFSKPETVRITVKKNGSSLTYADLSGSALSLPAAVMAEEGIMLGSLSGDDMLFNPGGEVKRGDFLVMAMKAAGISKREGLRETVFDDNEAIDVSIRPYVATAQERGYVVGSLSDKGLLFRADEVISRAEAAVIVARILELEAPAVSKTYPDSDAIPHWAKGAVEALCMAGIYATDEEGALSAKNPLTRAAAAEMLYETVRYAS